MKFGRYQCFEGTCRIIIRVGANLHGVTSHKILILILYLPPRETRFPNVSYNCLCYGQQTYEVCVYGTWLSVHAKTGKRARLICCYVHAEGVISGLIEICIHMWLTDRPLTDLEDRILCAGKLVYLLKKYCFDGTQRLITLFTKSCDWVPALF
jgi:hypothetical protein